MPQASQAPRYMPYPDKQERQSLPPVASVFHPQYAQRPALPPPHHLVQPSYPQPLALIKQEPRSPPSRPDEKTDKELLRKVSHSAIERRRRERINDKIMQLKGLVPSCAHQENLHKLSILQNAIDYIRLLKDQLEHQEQATKKLQQQQQRLEPSPPQAPGPYERRPSMCSLPSPIPNPVSPEDKLAYPISSPLYRSDSEYEMSRREEVTGLLMLSGIRPSPEPAAPTPPLPKKKPSRPMSVGSLLC
ncbi:hypothetical protein SpCBS45565_g01617 [Spizellomyces sp. 'palustris']|nr:hypothetical protein SpCBS45565_g01617 [Spizellomyces sp. 'palustris']